MDALGEQTAPLSGEYYLFSAWEKFKKADYDRAQELFSLTLLADEGSDNYYDYAYAGLGWTAIYKAKSREFQTDINEDEALRYTLRAEAIGHFESANARVQLRLDAGDMSSSDSLLYANVMAGRSTLFWYLSKDLEVNNDGLDDESFRNDKLLSYKKMIAESDMLLNQFPSYEFEYDININIDFIRWHRAGSFYSLSHLESESVEVNYLDSTIVEIGLFTDIYCDLSQILIPDCLKLAEPIID